MTAADAGAASHVPPLVLASASPRRRHLLSRLGIEFDVVPANIDEALRPDADPAQAAERLALEKARAVAAERPAAVVVGCDTIVVIDHTVLLKPVDAEEAVEMLLSLQGREHRVETGIAVVAPDGRAESSVVGVHVRIRPFDRAWAEAYVATGEPLDKAGAYGIQGKGATLVERIEGDYFAVMGLPLARLISLLRAVGLDYDFQRLVRRS